MSTGQFGEPVPVGEHWPNKPAVEYNGSIPVRGRGGQVWLEHLFVIQTCGLYKVLRELGRLILPAALPQVLTWGLLR